MFEGFTQTTIKVNGINTNLRFHGSGPPILLLHGYPQTHFMWHKLAPLLTDHYTVVAPDLRGYGDTEKPRAAPDDYTVYCKRTMAKDQTELMRALGYDKFHIVGHDRGARVGQRIALDYPSSVLTFTSLDVVPSQAAFESMDSDLSFSWFHWHLMRQPSPLPETLISNSAKVYLDFLLEQWCSTPGAITPEAYAEYLRCFTDPETIRATVMDYRSITLDLEHDEKDRGRKLSCPTLVLWGKNMDKRPGWQTGKTLDILTVWQERAKTVRGKGIDCGHFIPEERPAELANELSDFLTSYRY